MSKNKWPLERVITNGRKSKVSKIKAAAKVKDPKHPCNAKSK